MIPELLQYLTRRKARVIFDGPTETAPVSRLFGFDRGTPIDRYYIERFLGERSSLIRGRTLEVADDTYTRRFGGDRVEHYGVLHATPGNPAATLVGDLTAPDTLPEHIADCFVCTQTFNFVFDVPRAIQGAHRLLRPGGVLLATVSGISQISRYDMERWGDFWRFTSASIQRLLEPVFRGGVEVLTYGNVLAATAFLRGLAVEDLPDRALLDPADPDYQLTIAAVARRAP